ncbi:hypothetical protein GH714_018610 [Hevea brasiliensis]|uniref:Reverse transcriptase zinc-binding domain-containing protein n=1 Tax=Hevea brasiliensis TaxID=3981 RepID=A0A6A6LHL5_HEVBR|nr:hypothetical protein GH714_018610 [Hevea brasiliensis]
MESAMASLSLLGEEEGELCLDAFKLVSQGELCLDAFKLVSQGENLDFCLISRFLTDRLVPIHDNRTVASSSEIVLGSMGQVYLMGQEQNASKWLVPPGPSPNSSEDIVMVLVSKPTGRHDSSKLDLLRTWQPLGSFCSSFCDDIHYCNLVELPLVGHPFTWEKGRGSDRGADAKIIWHFNKNGLCSVKSRYKVAVNLGTAHHATIQVAGWKNFLALALPPKIQNFMWRASCDILPTKSKLIQKGVSVNGGCLLCGAVEDLLHVLSCLVAMNCWNLLNVHVDTAISSFADFFFQYLSSNDKCSVENLCAVLWNIWAHRNFLLWQGRQPDALHIFSSALKFIQEWQEAQQRLDAIVRDEYGYFLVAYSGVFVGCREAGLAEAMGIREALAWIPQLGFENVILEIDCQELYFALLSSEDDWCEFGVVSQDCIAFIQEAGCFSLQ